MSDLVAERLKQTFPFGVFHCNERVVEPPVDEFSFRKLWTCDPGTVAQGNPAYLSAADMDFAGVASIAGRFANNSQIRATPAKAAAA